MHFDKFIKMVERSKPDRIKAMISVHVRVATKESPKSQDAICVLRFSNFLASGICPSDASQNETDFYKRTAERMVEANLLEQDVLDQFP
jgi:hypothetical protein